METESSLSCSQEPAATRSCAEPAESGPHSRNQFLYYFPIHAYFSRVVSFLQGFG
jgi:hypothetical protein